MNRRQFLAATVSGAASLSTSSCVRQAQSESILSAAAFRAASRYALTRFGRIAYMDRGAGDAVLFLHGFPLNSFQWRGAIEQLSSRRRCIAPDFLAMGYTEVADGQSVAPDAQVAMVAEILDYLSIPAIDLVANDSGGAIAQMFVARFPKRVRSLLLTNCDTEMDSPPAALLPVIRMSREGTYADQWLIPWLADKALARSAKGIGGMCYADSHHPTDEAIEYYFRPLVESPRRKQLIHAYAIALERNPLVGIEAALKQLSIPVRIVWGTGDTIFSPGSDDHLAQTFTNSRGVRKLIDRKLFWPEEMPEVIAEEARGLWGS